MDDGKNFKLDMSRPEEVSTSSKMYESVPIEKLEPHFTRNGLKDPSPEGISKAGSDKVEYRAQGTTIL